MSSVGQIMFSEHTVYIFVHMVSALRQQSQATAWRGTLLVVRGVGCTFPAIDALVLSATEEWLRAVARSGVLRWTQSGKMLPVSAETVGQLMDRRQSLDISWTCGTSSNSEGFLLGTTRVDDAVMVNARRVCSHVKTHRERNLTKCSLTPHCKNTCTLRPPLSCVFKQDVCSCVV